MKKLILTVILVLGCPVVYAASVTYNFSLIHAQKIIEGTCYLYPNVETIDDPVWIDDGSEAPQIPKWSDTAWTKEVYRRIIIRDTRRGLLKKQRDMQEAIDIPDSAVEIQ